MDEGLYNNVGRVNFYEVNPANDLEEQFNQDFNDEDPPPPAPLMRQNASFGPRIRTAMNHNLPIRYPSRLSVFRNGHHVNIGAITGNVATFNCHETYTQAVYEQVWVQQCENGQWYMTVICNRLPALAPAPVPAPVHDQMQEPMAGC